MRKIRNTNSHIEFLECKDNGDIINSKGFQLGEICYQLTPQKVTFYLETADNPFSTMVWSIDLPFEFNDVTVSTTEEAADALQGIMVLDDLSKIREDLDNEILRSTNEDTKHDVLISGLTDDISDLADEIEAETARALSAETRLEDKIDAEVSRAIQKENAILNKVNLNTERISGLTDALDVEIQNRIAGDTQLQNNIGIEADDRRHADVILKDLIDTVNADLNAEIQNIINDESGLSETLTSEIIRATNKDQEHDDLISGLTGNIAVLDEEKQNKLYAGKYITINGNNISADSNHVYRLTQQAYDNLPEIDVEGLYIITDAPDVDLDVYAPLSALTAEIERATSAETQILETLDDFAKKTDLQAEVDRAIAREDDIAEDLEDEFHRAQSAEHLLEDKITTERERAIGVEDELRDLIISGGTGSGITSAQVQTMIENYTYDKEYIDDKQDKVSIWNGTGMNAVIVNNSGNTASQNYAFAEGVSNRATNTAAHAEGMGNVASGGFSHAEGRNTTASQIAAHTEGSGTQAKGTDSHAEGTYTIANNNSEHASGYYNVSRAGSTPDDKTLFSVGNGTSAERHNALEIMQNGDIFISSGDTDIKLQDYLGGGSGGDITILSGDVISLSGDVQNISGDIITLSGDVIALETKIDTLSGNVYTKDESDAKYQLKDDYVTGVRMSAYTYSKDEIDDKIASGGTKYTAGRAIKITTGATADTISFNLPIYSGSGTNAIVIGNSGNTASGQYSVAEGYMTKANGHSTHAEGYSTTASNQSSHAEGYMTKANGDSTHAEGVGTEANGNCSHAEGIATTTNNLTEHASGYYNICLSTSLSPSTVFSGDSGNTLFTVGNGYQSDDFSVKIRHNALDIRQDGSIYIADTNASGTYYEKPMIKLQDALGQGGGITSGEVMNMISGYAYSKTETSSKTEIDSAFSAITKIIEDNEEVISGALNDLNDRKQDVLTAGDNIDITNNVISTVTKFWCGTQAQYDAITIKDPNTVYMIHD